MRDYYSNYHVHTLYCGHGEGHPEDYAQIAYKEGLKNLGFTEHAWLPGSRFTHTICGHEEEYFNEVHEAKEKYKGKVNIYCGLEIDYFPDHHDYYKELLKKYDYLTLSVHYLRYNGPDLYGSWHGYTDINLLNEYRDLIVTGIKSKLFKFVNHPDNFVCVWNDDVIKISMDIINTAISYDIPLELNGNQFERSTLFSPGEPREKFWELVGKTNCKVLINTDAHKCKDLLRSNIDSMIEFSKKHNLNVLKEINI